MIKQFLNLKKDSRTRTEILSRAFDSFEFDYQVISVNQMEPNEVSSSDAIKHLPNLVFELKPVDYFA